MKTFHLLILLLLLLAVLLFTNADARYVAMPLFACVFVMAWVTYALWQKDGGLPLFDIGFICALATFVYSVMPLINFWAGGLRYGTLSDSRLLSYNLTPEDVGNFHWRHVTYLAALAFSYVLFRKRRLIEVGNVANPPNSEKNALVFMFAVFTVYFLLLQLYAGFGMSVSYNSDQFSESYTSFMSMPLIVRQITSKLAGIFFIVKLAILFWLIQQCRVKLWRNVLLIWIAYEIGYAFMLKGARTGMMLFLLGCALMYHRLVSPIRLRSLVPTGLAVLALFTFMGIYRGLDSVGDANSLISESQGGFLSTGGEFQALLGTAYDVYQRVTFEGVNVPWQIYFNDIITVLPPQQIMPFEKISGAEWYLQLLGISGQGVGFMWGVITQCVVGLDWIELALRGCLLGFILAKIHKWYIDRKEDFHANIIYIYLCLRIYYTFRDTTGALLAITVWELLPFLLFLWILSGVLDVKRADAKRAYT